MSIGRRSADLHELVGHKYVGRALVDDLEVRVDEKVRGTLLGLLTAISGAELRTVDASAPATEFGFVSRHLMSAFTRAAARYVADRRCAAYAYRQAQGPTLAGGLDMARTVRLHATGRLGHFAFHQGYVTRDRPIDRLVLAGLEAVDRMAEGIGLESTTIYEARWLSGALEEVRDERFLLCPTSDFLAMADKIEAGSDELADDVDLARLAVAALLHRGFEPEVRDDAVVPRAWFVDLETLFETSVRTVLRELLQTASVDRGEWHERRLFTGGSDLSRTYPDLVVHREQRVVAIGDVKYKGVIAETELPGPDGEQRRKRAKEARSDIYQLLVHAASLGSPKAFLVYAGEHFTCRYLGVAATGTSTWSAQVRPAHLSYDLRRLVRELPIEPQGD